jgi:nitrite reductase/ring-hydroxylating ferredoxin subunit
MPKIEWRLATRIASRRPTPPFGGRRRAYQVAQFVKVASKDDISPGHCKTVQANGKSVALHNVDGTYYATDDACIHKGGPLGEGTLEGAIVTCPWHHWQYDVTTGKSTVNPKMAVDTYSVKVEGDDVLVEV